MYSPFSLENISEIFGADAADTEEPARLYTFFVSNDSYDEMRVPNPLSLIVGQKGIGKTALMVVSSLDDKRDGFPHIFIRGSQILSTAEVSAGGSATILKFRSVVEDALLHTVADTLSREAAEFIGAPVKAGGVIGTLTRLGTSIATGQSEALKRAASKLTPWLLRAIPAVNVYIDDTDVEWDGSKVAAERIGRLIQACFQLASEAQGDLRFKISIRSDLFNYLSVTADFIDKIQSSVVKCRWKNDQVFRVIAKRIAVHDNKEIDDDVILSLGQEELFKEYFLSYFEERFRDKGAWENHPMRQVLLSFVRQRPRDLIGLCRLAAKEAERNGTKIDTSCLKAIISEYSNNRLNDTVVEFRTELPT